jgi:hypothetical protein
MQAMGVRRLKASADVKVKPTDGADNERPSAPGGIIVFTDLSICSS